MTTAFPQITPTEMSHTLGQYPVKRFTTIAGTGTSRIYGNQPFNAGISVQFSNIRNDVALSIVDAYEQARGAFSALSLPTEFWKATSDGLRERFQRDYSWRFAEQPQFTPGPPGLSSVTVRLEGQRDG